MGFTIEDKVPAAATMTDEQYARMMEQKELQEAQARNYLAHLAEVEKQNEQFRASMAQQQNPIAQQQAVPGNMNIQYSNSAFIPKPLPHTSSGLIDGNAILEQIRAQRRNVPKGGVGTATIYGRGY